MQKSSSPSTAANDRQLLRLYGVIQCVIEKSSETDVAMVDDVSIHILRLCEVAMLNFFRPVAIKADGNC